MMEPEIKETAWDRTNLALLIRHFSQEGDDAPALALLAEGADPNRAVSSGKTALHWAVFYDRPVLVQALLERGAEPDGRGSDGLTPLMQAKSAAVARLLLESGADVNATRSNLPPLGWTPLMSAAFANRVDVTSVLLEFGADLNWRDARGRNALSMAVRREKHETVRFLLDHGASVGLAEAALMGDYPQAREFLAAGADLQTDEMGKALRWAADAGHFEIVVLLLDHGAPIDATDDRGHTALMRSVQHGRIAILRLLLQRGADPNVAEHETTALSMCTSTAANRFVEAQVLLEHGARLHVGSQNSAKLLVGPCFIGNIAMIELLLRHGADPNEFTHPTPTSRGAILPSTNALMTAVQFHRVEAVKLLLQHGADPLLRNNNGRNALDAIQSFPPYDPARRQEILALLEAAARTD